MKSDYVDPDNSVQRCMKCLDDINDEDFWEHHQELYGAIWCVNNKI